MNTKLDCVFAENEYGKYAIPACTIKTEHLSKTILQGGVHERPTIEYILKNRGDGIVIHAGTYFGDFLPAISGLGHRVYAFEPGLQWYRCAKITMQLNFLPHEHHTQLYNFGLGADFDTTRQLLTMRFEDDGEGGASRIMTHPDGVEPWRMEFIRIVPLDYIVADPEDVSLIHLDIEGYEEYALMGAKSILSLSRPILILEVANDDMVNSEFYKDFIFGELAYEQVDNVSGNRVYRSRI